MKSRLGRNVDGIDHESSSAKVAGRVGKTENGDGDVSKVAVDEADKSYADGRQAWCCTDTQAKSLPVQRALENTAIEM